MKDSFQIEGSDLIVNIDDIQFKNTPRVLVLNDFDIIAINRIEGRFLSLDINFYDRLDNHIAIVLENNWFVETRLVWDVEYKPQHLIIRNEPRKISFEARIENGEVFLRGEMYYRGHQISLTDEAFMIPSRNIRLSGFSIVDFPVGISEQV